MADLNFSVDDILAEIASEKKKNGAETKKWSLDDINALLNDEYDFGISKLHEKAALFETRQVERAEAAKKPEAAAKTEAAEKAEMAEKLEAAAKTEPAEKPEDTEKSEDVEKPEAAEKFDAEESSKETEVSEKPEHREGPQRLLEKKAKAEFPQETEEEEESRIKALRIDDDIEEDSKKPVLGKLKITKESFTVREEEVHKDRAFDEEEAADGDTASDEDVLGLEEGFLEFAAEDKFHIDEGHGEGRIIMELAPAEEADSAEEAISPETAAEGATAEDEEHEASGSGDTAVRAAAAVNEKAAEPSEAEKEYFELHEPEEGSLKLHEPEEGSLKLQADEEKYIERQAEEDYIELQPEEQTEEKQENVAASEKQNVSAAAEKQENEKSVFEKKALAGKTIGLYPVRNEKIEHNILTEKIEKSGGMETDKYRERFLNRPKQRLDRTADYERLHGTSEGVQIERPGLIIKKSKFINTADLEPMPTIISVDAERRGFDKTIVAGAKGAGGSEKKGDRDARENNEEYLSGQLRIGGFSEEEHFEQIDEENAEEKLREKRDEKVASFKLDGAFCEDEAEGGQEPSEEAEDSAFAFSFDNPLGIEYEEESDYPAVRAALLKAKRRCFLAGCVQLAATIAALVIGSLVAKAGGDLSVIGGGPGACAAINILLLLLSAAVGFGTIKKGFSGLKRLRPNASAGVLALLVACILENLAIMIFMKSPFSPVPLYTAAGCFALLSASVAGWLIIDRVKGNFDFITNGTRLYSSEKISEEDDAFEIGRGLLMGEPEICYNARIKTPKNFISNSFKDDPADSFSLIIVPAVFGVAALIGLIFGLVKKNPVTGFGMFTAVCCIAMPLFSAAASNMLLLSKNRELNSMGAAITGYAAVNGSNDINAVVLDSTDIFREGTCSIIGIKTFRNMRIDDAILYAAALITAAGGPLGTVFGNVILGKKELLPPVESPAYEEKLGLSGWIHGRRVLAGSRELLINHNVKAPDAEFEKRYLHDGRKLIYLAIAGKTAAMFVIKYRPDPSMRKYLQNVDKAGISLLVKSCDCNISEEMICSFFNLPLSAVKILSPVSGEIFDSYRNEEKEDANAALLHNGTIEASLRTLYEAGRLSDNAAVNRVTSLAYAIMALIIFIIMTALAGPVGISGGQIVLFQALWGMISVFTPLIRRKFSKE